MKIVDVVASHKNPGIGVEVDRDTLERYGRRVS
jgi:L-alanine-DL-glutamate epimerase-like enolase superfamily enzyme